MKKAFVLIVLALGVKDGRAMELGFHHISDENHASIAIEEEQDGWVDECTLTFYGPGITAIAKNMASQKDLDDIDPVLKELIYSKYPKIEFFWKQIKFLQEDETLGIIEQYFFERGNSSVIVFEKPLVKSEIQERFKSVPYVTITWKPDRKYFRELEIKKALKERPWIFRMIEKCENNCTIL